MAVGLEDLGQGWMMAATPLTGALGGDCGGGGGLHREPLAARPGAATMPRGLGTEDKFRLAELPGQRVNLGAVEKS